MRVIYRNSNAYILLFMALAVSLGMTCCAPMSDGTHVEINEEFVNKVLKLSPGDTIKISSRGGWPEGMMAGYYINENDINVEVEGYCVSACAEFILSASKNVLLKDSPIIAVHGNPEIYRDQKQTINEANATHCKGGAIDSEYTIFTSSMGINPNYNKRQAAILNATNIGKELLENGCYKPLPDYEVDYWVLSNADLNYNFSGNFVGMTCTISEIRCLKTFDAFFKAGTLLSDGEDVYKTR